MQGGRAVLKLVLVAIAILFVAVTGANARECAAAFKPQATTGLITNMTLYRFVDHFELQFSTPSHLPLLDMTLEIDNTKMPMFLFGGLDDELFVVTDDENSMGISEKTLNAMAKGKTLEIRGRSGNDQNESAVFELKGFGAAVKKIGKECR